MGPSDIRCRTGSGLAAILLAGALSLPCSAQPYHFTLAPASSLSNTTEGEAEFTGHLIGNWSTTNTGGTQTRPGLFGGSGNQEIPITGAASVGGDSVTHPAGMFDLDVNTGVGAIVVSGFGVDLLNGQTPDLNFVIELSYQSFHTVNPSALYIGGFTLPIPLGQASLTELAAQQTSLPGAGVLTPAGPNAYTFTAIVPLEITVGVEFLGQPIGSPTPLTLPVPVAGTLTLSGSTAQATVDFEVNIDETLPIAAPPLTDLPLDLPTILPPGGTAHLLVTAQTDAIHVVVHLTGHLVANGERACVADFNGDGVLNVQDFVAFQTAYALGDPRADINGDGQRNILDFIAFQTAFAIGCP